MTSVRFQNPKLAIRNMVIHGGMVLIIISYTKARASNNHSFYVIRYLPDKVGGVYYTLSCLH